jgi:hypothetical protein
MQTDIPLISYLVTCKNEDTTFKELLDILYQYKNNNECIILDDYSTNDNTINIINDAVSKDSNFYFLHKHELNNDYGSHKNYGKSLCKGKYIFQIDADEIPSKDLLAMIPDLIEMNSDVDLFWIPRINDFTGVNQQNAIQWQWKLSPYENRFIVNWPDFQGRLFKNISTLRWERRLHEKIEGVKVFSRLPPNYVLALHHKKTIQKQIETNIKYNKIFTDQENQ